MSQIVGPTSAAVNSPAPTLPSDLTSAPSTMTILPPGAYMETLAGEFVEGAIITTTSSGKSEPTIVPVIVPLEGPPRICWGCIPTFPVNIQFKIPGLCFKVLGFKISNCSKEGKDEKGGSEQGGGEGKEPEPNKDPGKDGKEDDPEKKKDPGNEKDPGKGKDPGTEKDPGKEKEPTKTYNGPEPSSTVKSSTTCTTTVSATYASVFCSVTTAVASGQGQQDGQRQQPTSCSTLVYSTATACDTLVASTTTTLVPQETDNVFCSSDTCGAASCKQRKKNSQQSEKRAAPFRDSQPGVNEWSDPKNYNNDRLKFMRGEAEIAESDEKTHVEQSWDSISTTNWIKFDNQVNTLAVSGLWGCTSVVVVSTQGAWASHFWENPSFRGGDERFEADVIRRLHLGLEVLYMNEFGLDELRNNDHKPQGHMFDDANSPRVFVMAPTMRVASSSVSMGESPLMYAAYVDRIVSELRAIFPNNEKHTISTIKYSPQTTFEFMDDIDAYGNFIRVPDFGDAQFNSHLGKLLIQYQPGQKRCEVNDHVTEADQPKAMWRIWFEGNDIGDRHHEWVPAAHQHLKRDEQSCSIKGDDPGSKGSTSVSPPATTAPIATAAPPTTTQAPAAPAPTTPPNNTPRVRPPPPLPRPAPPLPKICNLHLHEYVQGFSDHSIVVDYDFYDGDGKKKHSGRFTKDWNQEYLVPTGETGLAHPISVAMTNKLPLGAAVEDCPSPDLGGTGGRKTNKRCARTQWKSWVIQLKYGDLAWASSYVSTLYNQDPNNVPNCQVGAFADNDWDGINKIDPHRQMDCRFPC
ncbi:hypothetical protein PGQ11_006805 [Apiospora arundinis]|uniref:Uncharacterized protein n=1 Tax=Apiospora arundinis TaxID=335852 RepID=A0ABR2IUD4_9PEZI